MNHPASALGAVAFLTPVPRFGWDSWWLNVLFVFFGIFLLMPLIRKLATHIDVRLKRVETKFFLDSLRGRLLTLFGFYVFVLLGFAQVYEKIYRNDPQSFLFSSDITSAQINHLMAETSAEVPRLRRENDVLVALTALLSDNYEPAAKEYKVGALTAVFSLAPGSPDIPSVWELQCKDPAGKTVYDFLLRPPEPGDNPTNTHALRQMTMELSAQLTRSIETDTKLLTGQTRPEPWTAWDFVYFSGTTLTTVGFGDILPANTLVRMVVLSEVLCGVFIFLYALNVIVSQK